MRVARVALEAGAPGLEALASREPGLAHHVLAMLTAIPVEDSVRVMLAVAEGESGLELRRISHPNTLLTHKWVRVPRSLRATIEEYLDKVIRTRLGDVPLLGTAYCALREVGDGDTLVRLKGYPRLPPPWDGAKRACERAIRARLKRSTDP